MAGPSSSSSSLLPPLQESTLWGDYVHVPMHALHDACTRAQKSIIWLVPISVLKTYRMGRGTADKQVGLGLSRGLSSTGPIPALHAIVGIPGRTYYQPNLKHRIKDGQSNWSPI